MWCHLITGCETKLYVMHVVILLVTGWLLVLPTDANNLQEQAPLMLRPPSGQTGLHFGFSLAHYTNNSQRWLLVGAPRSNASKPDVVHPGGLYKCQLSKSNVPLECLEVNIDLTNKDSYPVWAKSNNTEQGLGFSLASDGKAIVVCAPQWFAARSKFNEWSYLPAGMCFAAKSPAYEFKAFSPPFDHETVQTMSYLSTGSCQFGMSAAYVKGQNTFAFGAPGCWTWRGDTWEVGLGSKSDVQLDSPRFLGKLQQGDSTDPNWESFGRYAGYSVASLKFGNKDAIVSSIPRIAENNDFTEKETFGPTILILIQHPDDQKILKVDYRITPSKVTSNYIRFAFFGYSLATLDLNGDGLEDLVVGAPFYNNSTLYDQGAIFIYMQTASENYETGQISHQMKEEDNAPQRMGIKSFSRFGSCVAAIGDLDGDGYEDLAVGAPYMAVNSDAGTGAVYIYMGSQNGLEKDAIQIIKAANQFGFGSSIAQQLPSIEGQGYDVAVGAYVSDTVLVFQSKEVVGVIWNLTFSGPIDLNSNTCLCVNYGSLCPCVDGEFCLQYQKKVVKNENSLEMGFSITLSAVNDELFFENEKAELQKNFAVQEGEIYCETFKILAEPGIEEIKSFSIMGNVSLDQEGKSVILDRHSIRTKREQLTIAIHCNSDDISGCQSDIILQYDILDNYVLMSLQPMKIHFKVKNEGETAYESKLNIRSSDVFIIHGIEGSEITCERTVKEIDCMIGRLYNNSEISFNLSLTPAGEFFSSLDIHAAVFDMTAEVQTLSTLSNPVTAIRKIEAPIIVDGSLQLYKQNQGSHPRIVYFNSSSYYKLPREAEAEEELGPEIKHEYSILNPNKFSIYEAELYVHWPHTIDGKHFLYLLENLSFTGMSHNCQYPSGMVDPFNLKANRHTQGSQSYIEEASAHIVGIGGKSPEYKLITCSLGKISADGQINVSLRSRLVLRTLLELEVGKDVKNASSFVDLHITKMPLNYDPPKPSSSSISTEISYEKESPEAKVPVWLYVVAALSGLLLLGIIIIIMWKCGFFKRQRMEPPDNADENQKEHLTKEEEEEDHDEVKTPTSPMLKETESAAEDFEFHRA